MKHQNKILYEALLKNNVLSEAELKQFQLDSDTAGQSLKDYLLQNSVVTEKQILISLSQHLNIGIIDLKTVAVDPGVIEQVPIKIAWYYKFLPIKMKNNVLTVVSADPLNVKTQDEIRMHLGFIVSGLLAEETAVIEGLKKHYGFASDTIDRILTKEPKMSESGFDENQAVEDLERQSEDPTVTHLVNQIILEAYKKRATDIHIEPYRSKVRFRYRIDGVLADANLPADVRHFMPAIISRIKIMANLSITEKRLPQDGSAIVKTKEQQIDLRVSTMPTPRGESIVIRVLPSKVMLFSLEKLGFSKDGISQFRALIKRPHGIIFITGPTGSGKTTTLYACLNEINSSERKIITIEDPVEYEVEGITQVQVNPKVHFDFSTGLRSILRHDPDILMVGEVRDPETAEIAIKTALTGHLVFSTLHTNDAASGITRLIDMGVEPYLVSSSVEAFIAQRLLRVICEECKEEVASPAPRILEEMARSLGLSSPKEIRLYHGRGCDRCNSTGYYGRVAVYEVMMLNDTIRAAILDKPRSDHIKRIAIQEGMQTLRQNAWKAAASGMTTVDEVMNVTVADDKIVKDDIQNNYLQGHEDLINKLAEKKIKEKYSDKVVKGNEV